MKRRLAKQLVTGLAVAAIAGAAAAQLPDRRAVRPVQAPAPAAPNNKAVLELLTEMELLKEQLRQLRGQLEVQSHQMEQMRNRQTQALADFDRRLRDLESRRAAAPAPAGEGSAVVVTPPVGGGAGVPPAAVPPPAAAAPPAAPNANEQQQYDAAFALMKQGRYEEAAKRFREFVARNPRGPLADNAQYWIGEAAYVTRDFRTALEEFNKVLTNYPQSPKVPDALLKIGYTHYELGAYELARETLNQVVTRYPNTAVARSAQLRLEKLPKNGQ